MPKRPQVGVGILITKDDRVLLIKRENAHGDATWSPPGGHLEYGELLEECAIRETQKEIDVIITDVTFLAITNDIFEVPEMHDVTIWMAGRYVSGEPVMHAEHELSAVDWFSWDALPEPLFLPFEHLLTGRCYPALWDFSGGDGERINNI
jgi:8-oxo-dGTP diphosphatase